MGAAYSQDLRDRIIKARESGKTTKQVAEFFQVSRSWIRRVMQRVREHGEKSPRPRGGATVIKIDLVHLRSLVQQQPDATNKELHVRLCNDLEIQCSLSAVDMALRRLGLTYKKRHSMRRNRIEQMWPSGARTGKSNGKADGRSPKRCTKPLG